jgi:hypothetical protein
MLLAGKNSIIRLLTGVPLKAEHHRWLAQEFPLSRYRPFCVLDY